MDTLTRMQAFVDVVDSEGFSAAARKVGRSKALMSKYVRELEDELGILLLNRTTRTFSLTEPGMVFYRSALEILQKVGDLHDTVREAGNGLSGRLRISAPRSLTDLDIGLPIVEFAAERSPKSSAASGPGITSSPCGAPSFGIPMICDPV